MQKEKSEWNMLDLSQMFCIMSLISWLSNAKTNLVEDQQWQDLIP